MTTEDIARLENAARQAFAVDISPEAPPSARGRRRGAWMGFVAILAVVAAVAVLAL